MVGTPYDPSSQDLNQQTLRLRDDLVFTPQYHRQECFVHIESTEQGKYFRIGFSEYVFLSLFDGRTNFAQALAIAARKLGKAALSQDEAKRMVDWVVENKLGVLADRATTSAASTEPQNEVSKRRWSISPLTTRVRFGSPDQIVESLAPFLSWFYGRVVTALTVAFVLLAAFAVFFQWDEFANASKQIFAPSNWLALAGIWIGLKIVHEIGHAICCKRYGATVGDTGILFVLFAPMAYVDVSSSWRLADKWKRIHIALAGVQIELLIGACAAIGLQWVDSPVAKQQLVNVVAMASVTTILFNLNPLMRFDGYFVLSDLIEYPNLYEDSNRQVLSHLKRLFFGSNRMESFMGNGRGGVTLLYGYACAIWKIFVWVTLLIAAATLLHGAGIVLAMIGLAAWIKRPIQRLFRRFRDEGVVDSRRQIRAVSIGMVLLLSFVGAALAIPSPFSTRAPGVIDYKDLCILRSDAPGFVTEIVVSGDAVVSEGDVLLKLRNPILESDHRDRQLAIDQTRRRHRIALETRDTAAAQVELRNLESLQQELSKIQVRLNSLTIVAPRSGRIMTRGFEDRLGTYLKEGEVVCAIGDESQKEMVVSVDNRHVQEALGNLGETIPVRIGSRPTSRGRFVRLNPNASKQVTHDALLANAGGPLVGVPVENSSAPGQESIELVSPRFKACVDLSAADALNTYCGERGFVYLSGVRRPIGADLLQFAERWFDRQYQRYQDLE